MPRPNRPRTVAEEDHLARRIAYEREQRGMSYDGLAQRMTEAGCPIQASALFKVEKGRPRRRITVAEMVALGRVFELGLEELLLPPDAVADREAVALVKRWDEATAVAQQATDDAALAWRALADHVRANPKAQQAVDAYLRDRTDNPKYASAMVKALKSEGGTRGKHQAQG